MLFSSCSSTCTDPAGHAADGEDRHEQIALDAEQVVDDAGIEIDVDVDAVARVRRHRRHHRLQNLEPARLAHFLRQPLDAGAHVARARILGAIDAMAEAGDRRAGLALFLHIVGGAGGIADFLRHPHHVLGGAAMRRARQRGDRRRDRGMQIGLGADHHAGRERRGVGAVLGVQDEIAVDQLRGVAARLLALEHPQEIGGVTERIVGRDRLEPGADARMGGDDHRHLRAQPHALAQRRRARIIGRVRIEAGERGHRRAQHIHRMRL